MKKEIGKLLELLNEYEKDGVNEFETYVERWYCERTYQILSGKWENSNELKPCEIISKRYGFIKWLVENDKIDLDKVEKKFYNEICITDYGDKDRAYGKSDLVISVLSISDTPIEDLCRYLKDDATEEVDTLLKGIKKSCESLGL